MPVAVGGYHVTVERALAVVGVVVVVVGVVGGVFAFVGSVSPVTGFAMVIVGGTVAVVCWAGIRRTATRETPYW